MKSIVYASILTLSFLSFTTQPQVAAQTVGSSVDGKLNFSFEDSPAKYIEFNAISNSDGSTTGRMIFSGPEEFPEQDVDGTGRAGFSGRLENLYIEAEFDGLVVERNRAVMSGVITGSTLGDYIGYRVLLVVEDNGAGIDDKEQQDKFTWGIYKPVAMGWIPTDAEREDDDGWKLTWIATDAERDDDKGVPSRKDTTISCQSFPLSSYDFVAVANGDGNIQVQP